MAERKQPPHDAAEQTLAEALKNAGTENIKAYAPVLSQERLAHDKALHVKSIHDTCTAAGAAMMKIIEACKLDLNEAEKEVLETIKALEEVAANHAGALERFYSTLEKVVDGFRDQRQLLSDLRSQPHTTAAWQGQNGQKQ